MTEYDIEYLLKNNRWIAVYPTNYGKWKAYVYKKSEKGVWKKEFSANRNTAKECYDWIEGKFLKLKELK